LYPVVAGLTVDFGELTVAETTVALAKDMVEVVVFNATVVVFP
jgi:hypothetical protein